ncbi:MAG: hypothetical protein HY332_03625 [Chloroflexi bacterium]|nr:hypothetical protein [Chloroflexota bacterium]
MGSLGRLLGAAALVGLGFEIKTLQAYLALPAVFGVYLALAPLPRARRLLHLAAASVLLLVVSFAWPVVVDLTPPDRRPYIASTTDNRQLSLIAGTNGLQRIVPRGAAPAVLPAPAASAPGAPAQPAAAIPTALAPAAQATRLAQATQIAAATREALIAQGPAAIATFQASRAQPTATPTAAPAARAALDPRDAQRTQIAGATREALIAQGPAANGTFQAGRAPQVAAATQAAQAGQGTGRPAAGAQSATGTGSTQAALRLLVRYLTTNRGTARFMLAAPSALTASAYIIATGQPVMAYGGITGREQIVTPAQFAERVARGDVRYVVHGALGTPGSGSEVSRWVTQNCTGVPSREWAGDASTGGQTLYDCATRRAT